MADRLSTKKLVDWLAPKLTLGAKVVPGRLPDVSNRIIAVQMRSGPGEDMDGLFDTIAFQVACRGGENNPADAEDIAWEVDDVLTGRTQYPTMNVMIGDVYVSQIGRTGGGPSQDNQPDSQSRYTFTATYYAQVATNIRMVG